MNIDLSNNGVAFPLWTWGDDVGLDGMVADGTLFYVKIDYREPGVIDLVVNDEIVAKTRWPTNSACTKMINTWVEKKYWAGIDSPSLWAAAGCTPDEARVQLALPDCHPKRISLDTLNVLAALRNS